MLTPSCNAMLSFHISFLNNCISAPNKDNQDAYAVLPIFGNVKDEAFFGVYDGHGHDGHLVARYASDNVSTTYLECI